MPGFLGRLGDVMKHVSGLPPAQRVPALRQLLPQIAANNTGGPNGTVAPWKASEMPTANGGTAFVGDMRSMIVDSAGNMRAVPNGDLGFGLVDGKYGVTSWPGSEP